MWGYGYGGYGLGGWGGYGWCQINISILNKMELIPEQDKNMNFICYQIGISYF